MTNQIPPDVDWVKERAACTAGMVLELLKSDVSKDVAARQEMISSAPSQGWPSLTFNAEPTSVTVLLDGFNSRKGRKVHRAVVFALDGQEISVHDENMYSIFSGSPTLGDDGRCRLKVILDGRELELELWQFRRRALESLLFNADLP